ncbi:MAG: TrmB family transcriptional regulator [Candidatus Bathyarchaeia archaeon]|jgi:sugar-specific transcriptional regulator TrmB|nr:TrmB family transcriptional regulator [Candidatus Bathyarchaeota archaeon A05DMB-4]MDH7595673.1 helix-turn-helix domain-containing protein [Candidatus Bathyarchaeota archaeon]
MPFPENPKRVEDELSQKVSRYLELSDYEARVYVSLVSEGPAEARKLSIKCQVPRTKIFATLKKLVERGLVSELPEHPRKFMPNSPAKSFKPYLHRFREKTSAEIISMLESDSLVSLLEEIYKKTQSTRKPEKEEAWVVQGHAEILKKAEELVSRAKKTVVVVAWDEGFVFFYKSFSKLIDKLVDNGVNVMIGTPVNTSNARLTKELKYVCKVKNMKVKPPLFYMCIDEQFFLLAKLYPANSGLAEKSVAVVCYNSLVCSLFSLLLPRFP